MEERARNRAADLRKLLDLICTDSIQIQIKRTGKGSDELNPRPGLVSIPTRSKAGILASMALFRGEGRGEGKVGFDSRC